jgi:Putative adhesin
MKMSRHTKLAALSTAILTATLLLGCGSEPGSKGAFDRTFSVNGPLRLDMTTGSGDVQVRVGTSGEVRVYGEIHANGWGLEDQEKRINSVKSNPPIVQNGNLIQISGARPGMHNVSIDYTIEVPLETEIHCTTGSGDVQIEGTKGPANFQSGSGNVSATGIAGDIIARAGSGDIKFRDVQGQVQVNTGSGDIQIEKAKGEIRLGTGSGDIEISQPGDNVIANTGSGKIDVHGATADLRFHSSSGDITVDGNPGSTNYWDLHASSGNVSLRVPSAASFRLYAHTGSGDINADIPVVMEGTAAKHELRARIGDGKARVEIETSSGTIELH